MKLYHTGFQIIKTPDLTIGRKNADFGPGFYLSDNEEFSRRWAREKSGFTTYLNTYEFSPDDLNIKNLSRDGEWFDYITSNRFDKPDMFSCFDVIIGPIANDTIFETWGLLTSGLVERNQALQVLNLGPHYTQIVMKTEKALSSLHFLDAVEIPSTEIASYKEKLHKEEEKFQEEFVKVLNIE